MSYLYTAMAVIAVLALGAGAAAYASIFKHIPLLHLQWLEQGLVCLLITGMVVGYLLVAAGP